MAKNLKFLCLLAILSMLATCHHPSRLTYTNSAYGFQLRYPPGSFIVIDTPSAARIQLPIQPETNMVEKYLDIAVADGGYPCSSPNAEGWAPGSFAPQPLTINGLDFMKEITGEGPTGSVYEWTVYSISRGSVNVSLTFVLHSHSLDFSPTPRQAFDQMTESAVFQDVIESFIWPQPFIGTPPQPVDLASIKDHCMVHKARMDAAHENTPSLTFTLTGNTAEDKLAPEVKKHEDALRALETEMAENKLEVELLFSPNLNAYCRSGQDPIFDSIALAMKGQAYPILGRSPDGNWYLLRILPNVECWVLASTGEASGDVSGLQVVQPVETPTFTPLPPFDCGQFTNPQTCSQHAECTWNRGVTPGVCEHK